MKKFYTTLAIAITCYCSYAQNTYPPSGNVGIGTTSPQAPLQIGEFINGSGSILIPGVYNFEQVRLGQVSNGNSALEFVNHNGTLSSYGIKLLVDVDHGTPGLQFQYAPATASYTSLSYITGLYMNLSGNIGIGTTNPQNKLDVNGTIHSKEVKVDMNGWSDYVFHKTYSLPKLTDVKTYIDQNHHLPEIPSEQQVIKDGLNLGEMNKLLLKKVEELTLYLIEKDKKIDQQDQQITDLNKQVLKQDQQLAEQNQQAKAQQHVNQSLQEQINQLAKKLKN